MKGVSFNLLLSLLSGVFVSLIALPMISLISSTSVHVLFSQFRSPLVLSAVVISLETSLAVVFLAVCVGVPVAYLLAMKEFRGRQLLDTLVDLPISMPPLVAGLALLIFLGGNSIVGKVLSHYGISLLFSKKGIIVAQLFVSTPFLIKSTTEAFAAVDKDVIKASSVLGASSFYTFRKILLPLAKNGIYAGMVMTWARALGEFGATSMIAGCIPFKTETMTVAIYQSAMSGDVTASIAIALLLAIFSFTLLLVFKSRAHRKAIRF